MNRVAAAKKYQAQRQPSPPPAAMIRGTTGPTMIRANDDAGGHDPEAVPRRRGSNQAAIRAIDGASTMAFPSPVIDPARRGHHQSAGDSREEHPPGGDDQSDAHHDAGPEPGGEDARHQDHDRVADLVPRSERTGHRPAEPEFLPHRGEDGAVAEAAETDGREDGHEGHAGHHEPVARGRWVHGGRTHFTRRRPGSSGRSAGV